MVIIAINHRRSLCHVLVSKYQQTPKKRKEFITPFVVNLLFEFPSNNHHKGYNMPFDFFFYQEKKRIYNSNNSLIQLLV
ncbi:hypothetical protein OIU77_022179 [Salix suchowensis]|uniref:Uncharacterized protein n=1 Tax=Salix suchowensis TaxID=1278906 RepID=A0ABQ9C1D4_9ROSI|nr:hypothetical protein OIU77_022179 [Salix suchowensis]